jgi:hypothetical protein
MGQCRALDLAKRPVAEVLVGVSKLRCVRRVEKLRPEKVLDH